MMVIERSNTAREIISRISQGAPKVAFIDDSTLSTALLYLENNGIPTNRHEDYKYCNLDAILKKEFKALSQQFSEPGDIKNLKLEDTITLVVLNGVFSAELSDKIILKGFDLTAFSDLGEADRQKLATLAKPESDAFIALNTAFCGNGFFLSIGKGTELQIPVHILYISTAEKEAVINSRNFIEVQENAQATIIEHQVSLGNGKVFHNFLSEKLVADNATLTTYTVQDEGLSGFSVNTNQVLLGSRSKYDNTTVTVSGQVVRNNHNVVLGGRHSEAHLNGLFITRGTQLVDNHTLMDHQVPDCESNELYKGVINEKSTGVFNGKIFVRKDAQKTNAYQSSKNILLSDDATINTKPQLEIYANDVKCSHGTSTGKIDEDALFYLNARGIGKESGRKLLLSSFAREVINKIELEDLQAAVMQKFESTI